MHSFDEIVEKLGSLRRIVVTSHVAPDADAVCSATALALAFRILKREAVVYLRDEIPEKLSLLHPQVSAVATVPEQDFDGVVILDTASKRRVGSEVDQLLARGKVSINIDHHLSNDKWADINFVDASACASAAIVYRLLTRLGVTLDQGLADLLFAGILDDTGCFRFGNTTPEALQIASDLVRAGASPSRVANLLYFSLPARVLRLRGMAMDSLRLLENGLVAIVVVPRQMVQASGAKDSDCEGLIDEVRSIEGTICSVLIRELEDGWKISLRSKDERLNVNNIAAEFGGGGHAAAAGCRIVGKLADVETKLFPQIKRALDKLTGV